MASSKREITATLAAAAQESRLQCQEVEPTRPQPGLAADVAAGFNARPRSLPAKYFYDARGSALFERICDTPEYYPTRTEAALLAERAGEIIRAVRPDHIVELGSGSSRKTRHLLSACERAECPVHYWPFDVCAEMLAATGADLVEDYPWLRVTALVGDYLGGLARLPQPPGRRLFVFLGGTLGNFEQGAAQAFLRELGALLRPDDALLLGVDRVKDPQLLRAAYNDAAGITAEFNRNLLHVLNRELGADFEPAGFRHRAVYNEAAERIEMYLIAERAQVVCIPALKGAYGFGAGEPILTEISQKYSDARLAELLGAAGLRERAHFLPADRAFSLLLLER